MTENQPTLAEPQREFMDWVTEKAGAQMQPSAILPGGWPYSPADSFCSGPWCLHLGGKKPPLSHQFQQELSPLGSEWPLGASPLWLGKVLLSSAGFVSSTPPTVSGDQTQGLSGRGNDSLRKRGVSDDKGGEMTNSPVIPLLSNRLHNPVSDDGIHRPLRGDGGLSNQSLLYMSGLLPSCCCSKVCC